MKRSALMVLALVLSVAILVKSALNDEDAVKLAVADQPSLLGK